MTLESRIARLEGIQPGQWPTKKELEGLSGIDALLLCIERVGLAEVLRAWARD